MAADPLTAPPVALLAEATDLPAVPAVATLPQPPTLLPALAAPTYGALRALTPSIAPVS